MSWVLLLLAGCPPTEEVAEDPRLPLEGAALARRVSLDVRGVVPTLAELDRAEAGEIDALTSEWLADPRFRDRLVDAFAEDWLLRVDELRVEAGEFGLETTGDAFTHAFGDEPAQIMARVAAEGRPWTEVVTADWTMANELLAEMAPLEFTDPDDSAEWREARYTDGRPAGGVLMTSGLWMRYHTTLFNYNRARAAALSRLLLCYEFLDRPVEFTRTSGTSSIEVQAATQEVPGCMSCHAALDPLASVFFGFWPVEDKDGYELVRYHPERERLGQELMGLEPAYFGTPLDGVAQIGPLVAADPRFATCTVERTAERLWARSAAADDADELAALRIALEEDWQYAELVRAVLNTPEYRVGGLSPEASTAQSESESTVRLMSALILASSVEELTGFRWTWVGQDLLDGDIAGYRVLLGGADGLVTRTPRWDPTVSRHLTIQRLSEAAAQTGLATDTARARAERRLFGTTVDDLSSIVAPGGDLDAELTAIHRSVLGRAPSDTELEELAAHWAEVMATDGSAAAWASVASVLLRDPGFWSY